MSKLILEWLNSEVKLSREVVSLEDDFRNGYLLGELLSIHNQQSDFGKFINKSTPDAKITNFCLLEPTMRQIGVFFNSKVAFEIMNGKKGVMKTMLYEIRTALDSIKKRTMHLKFVGRGNPQIVRVIQTNRPSFDTALANTFQTSIRALMENPNDVMMANATKKFNDKMMEFRQSISMGHSMQLTSIEREVQQTKVVSHYRKKHDKEFLDAWEMINIKQWTENQTIAKKRKEMTNKVKSDAMKRKEEQTERERETARQLAMTSIDQFDERMKTEVFRDATNQTSSIDLAIKTVPGQHSKGIPKLSYLDRDVLQAGMIEKQKAMKEHHEALLLRQQAHGRRQRRFIRERESYHTDILSSSAEADIVNQLLNPCSSEELENHIKTRVLTHKNLFRDNRRNRDFVISNRMELDAVASKEWEHEEAMREYHWIVKPHIYSQRDRLEDYDHAASAAARCLSHEAVREVIDRLLDLTDWTLSCFAVSMIRPADFFADMAWNAGLLMFTSPYKISDPLRYPTPINVSDTLPYKLCERPLHSDHIWLLARPFESHIIFPTGLGSPEDNQQLLSMNSKRESDDDSLTTMDIINMENTDYSHKLANYLAEYECKDYIAIIANPTVDEETFASNSSAQGSPSPSTDKLPNLPHEELNTNMKKSPHYIMPPDWMSVTPAKHILGEVIVYLRCVADPIPADPEPPVGLPQCSLRIALCGISDGARAGVAERLSQAFGLKLIRAEELTRKAVALGEKALAIPKDKRSWIESISVQAYSCVRQGKAIHDETYVQLLLADISTIENQQGFVIEDFPNTREDARKLIQALSGIDYDSARPHDTQKASLWALPAPRAPDIASYDVRKCGLDAVIYLECDAEKLVVQRLGERIDLRTEQLVYIDENPVESVQYLSAVKTPHNPKEMCAIGLTMAIDHADEIQEFFSRLQVLQVVNIDDYDNIDIASMHITKQLTEIYPNISLQKAFIDILSSNNEDLKDYLMPYDVNTDENLDMQNLDNNNNNVEKEDRLNSGYAMEDGLDSLSAKSSVHDVNYSRINSRVSAITDGVGASRKNTGMLISSAAAALSELAPESRKGTSAQVETPAVQSNTNTANAGVEASNIPNSAVSRNSVVQTASSRKATRQSTSSSAEKNVKEIETAGVGGNVAASESIISVSVEPRYSNGVLHQKLATILDRVWSTSENQSFEIGKGYHNAMRDVRVQLLQRRRAMYDAITIFMLRRDDRQSIFEDFRQGFNEIDDDFRFDSDCICELQLRALELRSKLWSMAETRRKDTEVLIKKFATDGVCSILVHRTLCEGAALLQAETNRFLSSIHIIFDAYYALQKFNQKDKFGNSLEEVLPLPQPDSMTLSSGAKNTKANPPKVKEKEKKPAASKSSHTKNGKGEALLPYEGVYRQPLGPIFMSLDFQEIPENETHDDADEGTVATDARSGSARPKSRSKTPSKVCSFDIPYLSFSVILISFCNCMVMIRHQRKQLKNLSKSILFRLQ